MKKSKGFFLMQELLIFTLCSTLLTLAAYSFSHALMVIAKANALNECMTAGIYAVNNQDYESKYKITKTIHEFYGIEFTEIKIENDTTKYNLLYTDI